MITYALYTHIHMDLYCRYVVVVEYGPEGTGVSKLLTGTVYIFAKEIYNLKKTFFFK